MRWVRQKHLFIRLERHASKLLLSQFECVWPCHHSAPGWHLELSSHCQATLKDHVTLDKRWRKTMFLVMVAHRLVTEVWDASNPQPIGAQQEVMCFINGTPVLSLDKPLVPLEGECQRWEAMKEAVAANASSRRLNGPTVEVHDVGFSLCTAARL